MVEEEQEGTMIRKRSDRERKRERTKEEGERKREKEKLLGSKVLRKADIFHRLCSVLTAHCDPWTLVLCTSTAPLRSAVCVCVCVCMWLCMCACTHSCLLLSPPCPC